jgi:hypothetical protein
VPRYVPEDEPEAIGADPSAPLPSHVLKNPDPAKWLALYFDRRWQGMAQRTREWRGSRPSERGKAIGYLKGVMLTQVDPDIAQAYIDSFIRAARSGEIELKEGQLPFERFTGWWGRQEVVDPVQQEKDRKSMDELRRRRAESLAEVDDAAE